MKFEIAPAVRRSPARPTVRAGVRRAHNAYDVPGTARIEAWPHRPMREARAIARRIGRNAEAYLSICRLCRVPGVIDLRRPAVALAAPTFPRLAC